MKIKCIKCNTSLLAADTETYLKVDWYGGYYLCLRCASTCFDCGTEYDVPILNEDDEPWCKSCIEFFNDDREGWLERWWQNHGNPQHNLHPDELAEVLKL